MNGVISLVDCFSVGCVLDDCGRVSLAHLTEFSHFVDLYVLEENIYLDQIINNAYLSALKGATRSPLQELPDGVLQNSVYEVSDITRGLYDHAPTPFTFDLGSYKHWMSAASILPSQPLEPPQFSDSDDLATRNSKLLEYNSRKMVNAIDNILEELGKTSFTIMPSSRNLVPFLASFSQIETPIQRLYRNVTAAQRERVEDLLALTRPRSLYLPPLLTILLSRCESRADLPTRLFELRQEYQPLRQCIQAWLKRLDGAFTMREKLEIHAELENATSAVAVRGTPRRGFYKEVAGAAMSGLEDGSIQKTITKPAFAILRTLATESALDTLASRRFTGLIGLMNDSVEIYDYRTTLGKVFREKLDIAQSEITAIKQYYSYLQQKYHIEYALPG